MSKRLLDASDGAAKSHQGTAEHLRSMGSVSLNTSRLSQLNDDSNVPCLCIGHRSLHMMSRAGDILYRFMLRFSIALQRAVGPGSR